MEALFIAVAIFGGIVAFFALSQKLKDSTGKSFGEWTGAIVTSCMLLVTGLAGVWLVVKGIQSDSVLMILLGIPIGLYCLWGAYGVLVSRRD